MSTQLHRLKRWITGSISRKLSLFVVMVCLLLIALVWVLGVQLLEPAYHASIKAELAVTLDTIADVLDRADKEEVPLVSLYFTEAGPVVGLSTECIDRLNAQVEQGNLNIENLCIDMSTPKEGGIFLQDYLPSTCALHESTALLRQGQGEAIVPVEELRRAVLGGEPVYRLTDTQMIMGRGAANGKVAVIISANLERIPQAVGVLKKLMLVVSVVLVGLSILGAVVFSKWFTRPILRLSSATKEMAKGNYNVRVDATGSDEIADLSQDFNEMAGEVKRSVDLQRDLLANVSHDLRTPLTLIKGYAETVRDLTGDEPEKRTEQLNVIVDESDRLSELVGSVMELSRMSSGNEKPNPVRFDLAQLCEEMGYRYVALSAQQGYHFELSADEACDIYADPGLVERALHNLLGNALSHVGEDGYIGLSARKTPKGTARVEVSDHGPGISDADLPHLFDRYYRSRSDAGKPGSGLGLSIVKAIFEASGFTYGVESRQGEGATFWFEAPLAVGEKVPPHEPGAG